MIVEEIKSILEKNGYEIDPDVTGRIETMVESIRDDNQLYKLDHIIKWFNEKRKNSDMEVKEIGVNELEKWNVNEKTGNISHESGGFFEVIGVKVSNTFDREVGKKGWTQPMIAKNPGGILGILIKKLMEFHTFFYKQKQRQEISVSFNYPLHCKLQQAIY